jgi:hypothetical protein
VQSIPKLVSISTLKISILHVISVPHVNLTRKIRQQLDSSPRNRPPKSVSSQICFMESNALQSHQAKRQQRHPHRLRPSLDRRRARPSRSLGHYCSTRVAYAPILPELSVYAIRIRDTEAFRQTRKRKPQALGNGFQVIRKRSGRAVACLRGV